MKKWTSEIVEYELKKVIDYIGHFPTIIELQNINRSDLIGGINRTKSFAEYKRIFGVVSKNKPYFFWNDDTVITELNQLIICNGKFPTQTYLSNIGRHDLIGGISKCGGLNRFRKLLGYKLEHVPNGYWTEDIIKDELMRIITSIGQFPTRDYLISIGNNSLICGINKTGGIRRYQDILGYEPRQKPTGYWTEGNIILEIEKHIKATTRFPTASYLKEVNGGLISAISNTGGLHKYRAIMGYDTEFSAFISNLMSYVATRGKNTEDIVYEILCKYCNINAQDTPTKNNKLSKGNVIEFICDGNKKIGIDVTNAERRSTVYYKWTKKDYYKHLDELWIVVFSDVFFDKDYNKWNIESPSNVKVMSIDTLISQLQLTVDINMSTKIDTYKKCSFCTKEELKNYYRNE